MTTDFDPDAEFRKPNFELWMRDCVRQGRNDVAYRDGHYCTHCEQAIVEDDVAPINVVIKESQSPRDDRAAGDGARVLLLGVFGRLGCGSGRTGAATALRNEPGAGGSATGLSISADGERQHAKAFHSTG